jgi:ABC-type proline/glycine betaine transport system permease subunit
MISFWQALLLLVIIIAALILAFIIGFRFGCHASGKEQIQNVMPAFDINELLESMGIKKGQKAEDEDESLGYYDH